VHCRKNEARAIIFSQKPHFFAKKRAKNIKKANIFSKRVDKRFSITYNLDYHLCIQKTHKSASFCNIFTECLPKHQSKQRKASLFKLHS